jgi:membrane protein DedA with SNARE-associated domain
MGERLFELLRAHFAQHGYWTMAGALLLENAGVPVPGETILLFASFLAFSERTLSLPWIIVFGTVACTLGDNIGYWIGHRGGRPLLERYRHWFHISKHHVERGERLFERNGPPVVFVARFIFGMRILAGPLAGVLRMPWRQFVVFNFLGAALWVSVISSIGYLFGRHWSHLLRIVREIDIGLLGGLAIIAVLLWWRYRCRTRSGSRMCRAKDFADEPEEQHVKNTRESRSH